MKKVKTVIGYPRSGNHWLCYCIDQISNCGIHRESYAHGNTIKFWNLLNSKQDNLIFIFRNYKESIVRHLNENVNMSNIIEQLSGKTSKEINRDKTDYIALLKMYDEYPDDKKFLFFFEDLLKNPKKELERFLKFTEEDLSTVDGFMEKIKYHKQQSLMYYKNNVQTTVTNGELSKLIFHSLVLSKQDRIKIDNHLKENFPNLFEKYLNRYSEEKDDPISS